MPPRRPIRTQNAQTAGATAKTFAPGSVLAALDVYSGEFPKTTEQQVHGGLLSLPDGTAQPLDSENDIEVTTGIGKLVLILNAGSDYSGTITVTGTSVDRETGAETGSDTDTITVDALTTDGSDTDANGNTRHSFTGAYITSKWFTGAVVISTADVTLTDVDVYHCSFEQVNDTPQYVIDTFDINVYVTNATAELDAYLYAVDVAGSKVAITRESSLNLTGVTADRFYRLRRGNIGKAMIGTTDGLFVDMFGGPTASFIQEVSVKVWVRCVGSGTDILTIAVSGEGGGASAHGDLTGVTSDQHHAQAHNADSHSDIDTTTDAPALNEVLKWDGSNWVPGTAGVTDEFTFSIDDFDDNATDGTELIGAGDWKAIGALSFTATYSNAPGGMTAEVALTGSATPWAGNLSMTPVEGPETNTEAVEYPSSATGSITFTLSQSADASTRTTDGDGVGPKTSFSNTMRYGTNANGIGAQDEADIEALAEVAGPSEGRNQIIHNMATDAGNKVTIAHAARLSSIVQVRMDDGNGFVTASFNSTATTVAPAVQTSGLTTITNSAAFIEAFECVTSRLADLTDGSADFQIFQTNSTAQNHQFWGHVAKSGSITEADVESLSGGSQVASNSMSSRSMVITGATGADYTVIAYPARLGALTSIVIGGFESIGDFTVDSTTLSVTNEAGFQEDYRVYVSNNPGFTDPTTMLVTI